jgi:transposase-like protein
MPWRELNVVEERLRFVVLASRKQRNITELCREFEISRQTAYVWLKRYQAGGARAVLDHSRRPLHSPRRTRPEMEQQVVELRRQWPDWGAPKLLVLLREQHSEWAKISVRTVHRILERHGLILESDRHRPADKRFERSAPNELWQMDFKGPQGFNQEHPVGPLSILDDHSRYLIALKHLGSTRMAGVRSTLEQTFEAGDCRRPCWWITACRGGTTPVCGGSPNSRCGSCGKVCGCCSAEFPTPRRKARSSACTALCSGPCAGARPTRKIHTGWNVFATSTTSFARMRRWRWPHHPAAGVPVRGYFRRSRANGNTPPAWKWFDCTARASSPGKSAGGR